MRGKTGDARRKLRNLEELAGETIRLQQDYGQCYFLCIILAF